MGCGAVKSAPAPVEHFSESQISVVQRAPTKTEETSGFKQESAPPKSSEAEVTKARQTFKSESPRTSSKTGLLQEQQSVNLIEEENNSVEEVCFLLLIVYTHSASNKLIHAFESSCVNKS